MASSSEILLKKQAAEAELAKVEQNILKLKRSAHSVIDTIAGSVESHLDAELKTIRENAAVRSYDRDQPMMNAKNGVWNTFTPICDLKEEALPDRLRTGWWVGENDTLKSGKKNSNLALRMPAYIPFFGRQKAVIIVVNDKTLDAGTSLMRAMIQRIHTLIPHFSLFTLLDPEITGAFPMAREINTRNSDADTFRTLESVMNDQQRINSIHALTELNYFSTKVPSITMNEKFEFVCASNFPQGYESRTITRLANIANNGYISGRYVILVQNIDKPLPRDISMDIFNNAIELNLVKYDDYNQFDSNGRRVCYVHEQEAEAELWKSISERIATEFKPKEQSITWSDYVDTSDSDFWSHSASEMIETPIGNSGGRPLSVWFGKKDGSNCAHGMLAATTGAGKSNFYHAMILGLAKRYSPQELRMYLIDGKNGVEFEIYRNFPHAEVVSLKSSSELAGSVIHELVKEVARRNETFKKLGVNSYDEFRSNSKNILPRILLVIDEYQVLFESHNASAISEALRTLTAQARSAGIHLILGSQRFAVPNMQNKDSIFGNIQLRIGMKMTQDDRISLTEFGKEGKAFISACDLPGQIVVNQNSGSDGSNMLGKVALIKSQEKSDIINSIIDKSIESKIDARLQHTIVFEGDSAPNLDENPLLMHFGRHFKTMTQPQIQELARKAEHCGGFGIAEWNMSENPAIAWIGQQFNVYGQAAITLRRRKLENVIILGDRNASRYGMLVSTLFSLAMNRKAGEVMFVVYDRSQAGTDWNPFLQRVCNEVLIPADYDVVFENKVKGIIPGIFALNEELENRLILDQDERADLTPIYLFITEPEEIEALNLIVDKNGFKVDSEVGAALKNLYVNGSQAAIHVILSSSGFIPLSSVLSKKDLTYFRHRVSLQISDQESFDFLQNRIGSMLQNGGEVPTVAYYMDVNSSSRYTFKPYSIKDEGFEEQFNSVKKLFL